MDGNKTAGTLRTGGLSHGHVGAIAGVAIFLIGVVVMVDSWRIGAGWQADGPAGGYFPFRIGAILCVASAVVVYRCLFGADRDHRVFVTWDRLRLVLAVLVPTALYVGAIHFVGIYVASAVFIGAFMRVMDKRSWLSLVLVSVGVAGTLFWMFEKWFMVPLPKGPLESLLLGM
jgi:putative tricarboxylic transport membrane protein